MVVLSGQVPRAMLGMDAFQEADVVGITRRLPTECSWPVNQIF